MKLFVLLMTLPATLTISLVYQTPDFTALEGDSVTLFCEVDAVWQWCYFENVETGVRRSTYMAAEDDNFVRTKFGCGMNINGVSRSDSGEWKCQLSDTDAADDSAIRTEEYLEITVASQAEVTLDAEIEKPVWLGANITLRFKS
jgi:hypothetical protein